MASWWNPPLRCVINERGCVSAYRLGIDAFAITVTDGAFSQSRTKTVWRTSPWLPEICQALGIANPFA